MLSGHEVVNSSAFTTECSFIIAVTATAILLQLPLQLLLLDSVCTCTDFGLQARRCDTRNERLSRLLYDECEYDEQGGFTKDSTEDMNGCVLLSMGFNKDCFWTR